jgi:hypothetical protein
MKTGRVAFNAISPLDELEVHECDEVDDMRAGNKLPADHGDPLHGMGKRAG